MTVDKLHDLIMANTNRFNIIRGCELLEYIEDVGGFVSLLGEFRLFKGGGLGVAQSFGNNYVIDHPNPILNILNKNTTFRIYANDSIIIYDGCWTTAYVYPPHYL